MKPIEKSLEKTLSALRGVLGLGVNDDLILRRFRALGLDCAVIYLDGMSDAKQIARYVLEPMMRCPQSLAGRAAYERMRDSLVRVSEIVEAQDLHTLTVAVMQGQCALLMDTVPDALLMDVRSYARRSVGTPRNEKVVIGAHEAFNEALRDNIALVRRRLSTPALMTKLLTVGTQSPTQVGLLYLSGVADPRVLAEAERRLAGAAVGSVQSAGMLMQLLEDSPLAPLPQILLTERPDRVVSFLLEGQVVLLVDGSPEALAAPIGFWHLFHAPDDSVMRAPYGTFLRLLRLFGLLVALLLPGLFVGLMLHDPGALPMSLLTSVLQSRVNVPMSLFSEALLMLVIFDLINEAGTRVPGIMGSSLGLVSTLILGTAAVQAGLISPLMIIVVALSGLGSYAVPSYPLSLSFRILQLALLIVGGLAGPVGMLLGVLALLCWVTGMRSLGRPFLSPLAPWRPHNPDLILRPPIYRQRLRGAMAAPGAPEKAVGRMRRMRHARGR